MSDSIVSPRDLRKTLKVGLDTVFVFAISLPPFLWIEWANITLHFLPANRRLFPQSASLSSAALRDRITCICFVYLPLNTMRRPLSLSLSLSSHLTSLHARMDTCTVWTRCRTSHMWDMNMIRICGSHSQNLNMNVRLHPTSFMDGLVLTRLGYACEV